jgi:YHS domain-containing protein
MIKCGKLTQTMYKKEKVTQSECLFFGDEIKKSKHVDYKGKRSFFCCADCVKDFNKNLDKRCLRFVKQGYVFSNSSKKINGE